MTEVEYYTLKNYVISDFPVGGLCHRTLNLNISKCSMPLVSACGTSFDFHKQMDYLFLVGTEEGKIHKVCFIASTILVVLVDDTSGMLLT